MTNIPADTFWITHHDYRMVAMPAHAPFIAVRRNFNLPAGGGRVIFHITASDRYTLWIDGDLIASGPARSRPGRWLVDRLDLSGRLAPGDHRIAVLIHPPTGSMASQLYLPIGLSAWIRSGSCMIERTCNQWYTRTADWIRHHGLFTSNLTGWQEHQDSGLDWTTSELDEDWSPARVLGRLGETPPWGTSAIHTLPPPREVLIDTPVVWNGRISCRPRGTGNLATAFMKARAVETDVQTHSERNAYWLDTRGGNTITLDTGRTRNLRPGCRIHAVEGQIRLGCYLDIAFRGRPTVGMGFLTPREGSVDSVIVKEAATWWRTQPRGGRYVTWCATGRGRILVEPLCRSVEHPYPENTEFVCEDPFYQQLWDMAGETIRASTTDVLVDTCFRENALWTFDACATGLAAFYRFGDTAMPGHCFRLVADSVQSDGTAPGIVPSEGVAMVCMLLDQSLSWVHTCLRWHDLTGDDNWARSVLPAMRRVMDLVGRHLHDGFLVPPPWSWHWVDWAAIDKRPYSAVINLLALRAVRGTVEMALRLGEHETSSTLAPLVKVLDESCLKFRDSGSGAWLSHYAPARKTRDSEGIHNAPHDASQPVILHSNGLALGIMSEAGMPAPGLSRICSDLLSQPLGPANSCGPGWIADLLTPCCAAMDVSIIGDYLKRTYGRCFVETGAPTFGERFEPGCFNTAHGWGASVITLMVEGLLGLRPAAPGWSKVGFTPRWPGKGNVRYTLKTASGTVALSRRNGRWQTSLDKSVLTR